MAQVQNEALQKFAQEATDKYGAMANFVVDNNSQGVFAVLRANGYVFNNNGEAAIILKSILLGSDSKAKNIIDQLSQVPYLNNNPNGTGGLRPANDVPAGTVGASSVDTQNLGNNLLCTVGSLFGLPIGCNTGTQLTPAELEAQRKAEEEARKAKTRNTIIIVSIIAVVVIVITVIYFKNKK